MAGITCSNWTGSLAVHAAYTSQALKLSQPVKGVNPSRAHAKAWLKAAAHSRLRLGPGAHGSSDNQPCSLSLHLQEHVLVQQPLDDDHLKLAMLPCEQTSVLLLMPVHQDTPVPVFYCFQFFDHTDCDSFTTALRSMLDRQQKACQLAQHQAEQQSRAAALQQQQQQEQQQQHQATAEPLAHGQVTAEALAAAGQHAHSTADEAALQAEAKEAVKRFLLDPDFQRLVDQVDALWDEVEAEMEQLDAV